MGTDAASTINRIRRDADAVIIAPLFSLTTDELRELLNGIADRGIPSFTGYAREEVEQGAYAGLFAENYLQRCARRVALNIQRYLFGEKLSEFPVGMMFTSHLVVNMGIAHRLNIYPKWKTMTEAELINETREKIKRVLTISGAVKEALEVNLDIVSKLHQVEAGRQDIKTARSNLMPTVNLSALQTVIDKDRAEGSFGSQAERQLSGSAELTQVLYSESAWMNFKIQKDFQVSRENELSALKLDIISEVAKTYLDLLKLKTVENIQKKNLQLTRNHLEIAKIRRTIGVAGPSEVYRWESEIASGRKSVIEAISVRNSIEIALNRLLNRPLEEPFITEEVSLDDPLLLTADERFFQYNSDSWSFDIMRDFFVEIGLENSPELRRLKAAKKVRERILLSSKRAFWTPTLALQASVQNVFDRSGAGTSGAVGLPPEFSGIFKTPKDLSWQIGLNLSFPLYEGGAKFSAQLKAREELSEINAQYKAFKEKIEQSIRSPLHITGASYAAIALSRSAAEAAHKNLELVEDAYSKGVVSITELTDAQSAALGADLVDANSVYTFLIDLINVQRATGIMFITAPADERDKFYSRMDKYFAERR